MRIRISLVCGWFFLGLWSGPANADWVQDGGSLNINASVTADSSSIAISNGTPYVTWQETNGIYVKHFNGSSWVQDGGSLNVNTGEAAYSPNIAISNNTPYVTWYENTLSASQVYVKYYTGASWIQQGGSLNVNSIWGAGYPSIDIFNNTPYVAWVENNGTANQVYVKHYSSGWIQDGGSLNVNTAEDVVRPDITIFNGTPFVTWAESNGSKYQLYVKYFDGSNWITGGGSLNINTNHDAYFSKIACLNNDMYVTWDEGNIPSLHQIYVKYYDSGSWIQQGGSLNVNAAQGAGSADVAVFNGTPYVTWGESNGTNYMIYEKHYSGGNWVQDGDSINSINSGASKPRIAVNNSTPYISWQEYETDEHTLYVKHYEQATSTPSATPTYTRTRTATRTTTCSHSPTFTNTPTITIIPTISPTSTVTQTARPYALDKEKVMAYPSPARGDDLWFYYHTEGATRVRIEIFNVMGEKVETILAEHVGSGYHKTHWDISRAAPGVYLYRLRKEAAQGIKEYGPHKLVIVK